MIDQRNTGAQSGHKGCVLQAHDTGSDHNDFFRQTIQIAQMICIHNATVVERDFRAVRRPGASGDEDLAAVDPGPFAIALNLHGVRIEKAPVPEMNDNAVTF